MERNESAFDALKAWAVIGGILLGAFVVLYTVGAFAQPAASQAASPPPPAAPVPAQSFSVPVFPNDSGNINQICLWAADSRSQLGEKSAVAQYCLDLLNRIAQAQKEASKQPEISSEAAKSVGTHGQETPK